MQMNDVRDFGHYGDALPVPDLIEIQSESYERFLQSNVDPARRARMGLEGLLREVFPIVSYDENMRLEYVDYHLDPPRYTPSASTAKTWRKSRKRRSTWARSPS